MKRNTSIILVLAAAMLFVFSACNKTGGSGSGEKIQLEMKLEPGLVHKVQFSIDQTITQKMMGMSQKIGQKTEMYIKQEVESVDAEGVASIKVTYDRVKMSMDNALMGTQSYDSDDENSGDSMLGTGYESIIGKSFTMKMDKRARVVDVTGVEELLGDMMDGLGDDEMSQKLKSSFGADAMKANMQQMATVFPDVLIGEGDTWGDTQKMAGEFGLGMETTYKVDLIDAEKCVLAMESEVKTAKDAGLEMSGMKVDYNISGDQTGNLELDRKTGLVIKGEMEQDLKGEVETMGMKMPMAISSKITISTY